MRAEATHRGVSDGSVSMAAAVDVQSEDMVQESSAGAVGSQGRGAQSASMPTDVRGPPAPAAVQQPHNPLGPAALVPTQLLQHMETQQEKHEMAAIGPRSADLASGQHQESSQLARGSTRAGSSRQESHRHVALDRAAALVGGTTSFEGAADESSDEEGDF